MEENRIEVSVPASVQSMNWLRVSMKLAREAAASKGVAWEKADVFVALPESGRCFTKSPGKTSLLANG